MRIAVAQESPKWTSFLKRRSRNGPECFPQQKKDVFIFISPGFSRSLVWLFSLFHAVSGHDHSSFHSLLLVSFHISNVILCSGTSAYVAHCPILQVTMCPELGCKLPVQKKKSVAPVVYVCKGLECLCTSVGHIHAQWSPLYFYAYCIQLQR